MTSILSPDDPCLVIGVVFVVVQIIGIKLRRIEGHSHTGQDPLARFNGIGAFNIPPGMVKRYMHDGGPHVEVFSALQLCDGEGGFVE